MSPLPENSATRHVADQTGVSCGLGGEMWPERCCCNCVNHIADYGHPLTNGKTVMDRRGWICTTGRLGEARAFSGWSAHGLCELWKGKEEPSE